MISVWMIFASQQGLGGLSEAHILAPGHCETSKGLYLSLLYLCPHMEGIGVTAWCLVMTSSPRNLAVVLFLVCYQNVSGHLICL